MKIFLLFLLLLFTRFAFSQNTVQQFFVLNWTDEELRTDDIQIEYADEEQRIFSWGVTLEEYSAKAIDLTDSVRRVFFRGLHSTPILTLGDTTESIVLVSSGSSLAISVIRTSKTNRIIGLNICKNSQSFGRVRQMICVNLSNEDVLLDSVLYRDQSKTKYGIQLYSNSITLVPIETSVLINTDFVEGRNIKQIFTTCKNGSRCPVINPLGYLFDNCVLGPSDEMIIGLQISNSGSEPDKVTNTKP